MKKINLIRFFSLIKSKNAFLLVGLLIFWWTFLSNVNIGSSDIFHDRDGDGLSDAEEYSYGTDPDNPDTDGDGYGDEVEIKGGYDPLKPAPGDKIFFQNEEEVLKEEDIKKSEVNLTDDFFEKLATEKSSELDLLNNYYSDPESFDTENELNALSNISLTSEELQQLITTESEETGEMELLSEDEVLILDEVKGSEKEVKKKEKAQIEKYLTQILYAMSVNKPFAIESQNLLPQLGANYINEISGAIQVGQTEQLSQLKEKAQKTYEDCLKVEAPYVIKDVHIRMLSIIKYLVGSIEEEKLVDQEDPMMIALYVGKLQAALIEGESLKTEIDEIISEYDIEIFKGDLLEGVF